MPVEPPSLSTDSAHSMPMIEAPGPDNSESASYANDIRHQICKNCTARVKGPMHRGRAADPLYLGQITHAIWYPLHQKQNAFNDLAMQEAMLSDWQMDERGVT
ncbi:hypothetical protein N7462_004697 [Penicillium macrosclerotiorum]|uniref:uncharacterized protein n=1 Tax=Penicillium macrosclerotiorum TaxID=303699 RepID=UPI0025485D13|nr:uncharacterized protein N7462_004697 [Penicillium macrosclerotiorum]KAJ5690305.1 hypothetical protein N7462_004697 [Penicillium macrosclerotiorum]